MDIGAAVRTIRVEPIADPVPRPGGEAVGTADAGMARSGGAAGGARAPDYAEPIIGWRAWVIAPPFDAPALVAPGTGAAWTAGRERAAVCTAPRFAARLRRWGGHEAPAAGCSCGIRAAATPALAAAELGRAGVTSAPSAIGQVLLWGTVVECAAGWRASHAYPARLYVAAPGSGFRGAHRLEWLAYGLARYGVPVSVIERRTPRALAAAIEAAASLTRDGLGDP